MPQYDTMLAKYTLYHHRKKAWKKYNIIYSGADIFSISLMLGKIDSKKKGAAEDEMVREHHGLNGREFEQTPGDSEGQGSLACCSPWSLT